MNSCGPKKPVPKKVYLRGCGSGNPKASTSRLNSEHRHTRQRETTRGTATQRVVRLYERSASQEAPFHRAKSVCLHTLSVARKRNRIYGIQSFHGRFLSILTCYTFGKRCGGGPCPRNRKVEDHAIVPFDSVGSAVVEY